MSSPIVQQGISSTMKQGIAGGSLLGLSWGSIKGISFYATERFKPHYLPLDHDFLMCDVRRMILISTTKGALIGALFTGALAHLNRQKT